MTVSQTLSALRTAGGVVFDVASTGIVWICVLLEVEFIGLQSELPPERCGQLELSFLLILSFLIGMVLLILVHDGIESYRGRLSEWMKWLRTLPAIAAMLIAVATLGFRLLA